MSKMGSPEYGSHVPIEQTLWGLTHELIAKHRINYVLNCDDMKKHLKVFFFNSTSPGSVHNSWRK